MQRPSDERDRAVRRMRRVNGGIAASSVLGAGAIMAVLASGASADHHSTVHVTKRAGTGAASSAASPASTTSSSAASTTPASTAVTHTVSASAAPTAATSSSGAPVTSGAS